MRRQLLSALLLTATLAGCAVGPNFQRPLASPVASFANVPKEGIVPGKDIPADWWTLYRSPPLDALVRRALTANPDLAAARAALRQAQELARADRGAMLPSATASATTSRNRNPGTLASPLASNSNLYTLHTAQLDIGYTLDLFGGVRRQAEASAASAEAQRFQTEAAYLTLTSNVVAAAIGEAGLRDQIAATRRSIDAGERILTIMRGRERLGDAAHADVAAQEALLAQERQALPPLDKALAQQRDLIAALVGQTPGEAAPERVDLAGLTLPGDLPLSLPATLLDQRPDIRAAEANLHAAGAQVGVAIAARLPAITLTGSAGGSSSAWATLLAPANILWSVTGGLVQPLFDGGALRHRQRAAEAGLDQAKAQYRSTVLSAFQNVSDALAALQADADAERAALAAERAAADSLKIAEGQVRLGDAAPLQALVAEQAHWQAVVALSQARAARRTDVAALFQALGGGWWNRPAQGN